MDGDERSQGTQPGYHFVRVAVGLSRMVGTTLFFQPQPIGRPKCKPHRELHCTLGGMHGARISTAFPLEDAIGSHA
jgi:hypothetical protein